MRTSAKYQVIQKYASKYPIIRMCVFFGVSRSGYYSFLKRRIQPNRESALLGRIQECRGSGRYMNTYGCHRAVSYTHLDVYKRQDMSLTPFSGKSLVCKISLANFTVMAFPVPKNALLFFAGGNGRKVQEKISRIM